MKCELVGIVKLECGDHFGYHFIAGIIPELQGRRFDLPITKELHREIVGFRQVTRAVSDKKIRITIETIE